MVHRIFLVLHLARDTWITVAIATVGLALGWVAAVPLTLLASARLSQSALGRPMRPLPALARHAVRALLVFLRSIPELVWALLFVRVVGLGPTAGVLAIALTYCGMLGKVYAEVLESVDAAPSEALMRNGASRLGAFLYGALPQAEILIMLGTMLQIAGLISLNRSFAIVAAKREIKTSLMYRIVRHPLYASYFLIFGGYVLVHTTTTNIVIYMITMFFLCLRIFREERHLSLDPVYRSYMLDVRYRVIPFVF